MSLACGTNSELPVASMCARSQPFYEQVVSAMGGVLQIDLPSIMPLDCIISTNFNNKLIIKCVWPICAYIVIVLLSKSLRRCGRSGKADACIDFVFFLMFILYPSMSNSLVPTPVSQHTWPGFLSLVALVAHQELM